MTPRKMTMTDLAAQPVEIDRIAQLETALDDIRDACGREGAAMTPSEVSQLAVERIATLESDLAVERERSAAWEQTAQQESRNRDYYRGLIVAIGKKFGVSARTQDDGGVVEDVLVAKVPELVEGLVERSAALAATVSAVYGVLENIQELNPSNYDHDQVCDLNSKMVEAWLCVEGGEHEVILAAHDAEVARKAKIAELERILDDSPACTHHMADEKTWNGCLWCEVRPLFVVRLAALKTEGGKG